MPSTPPKTFLKPAAAMSVGTVVFLLALLMGIQPITTDLYLPALPALATNFKASMAQTQYTLSALLLAFGASQLLWGPLSDRFGRKPILLTGLAIYFLASLGTAWASSIEMLIYWRILQGFAMGAVVMCGRALVRDLYKPLEGAKVMSKGLSGLGVIACLSAPVGGILVSQWGTTATLMTLAVFGLVTWLLVLFYFKESIPHINPKALQAKTLISTWWMILKNSAFLTFSAITFASYGVLFLFLASSSFIFIKGFGFSATGYGLQLFGMSAHYIAGTFLCRHLLARFGLQRTMAIAGGLSLAGGMLLGVLAYAGVKSIFALLIPIYIMVVGHGIHQPCGQTGAIGPFPQAAGAASALNGFLVTAFAFGTGAWLSTYPSLHSHGDATPFVLGVMFWTIMLAWITWIAIPKYVKH